MRNKCAMKLLLLLWISMFSSLTLAEQTINVTLDRAWGLLIGDEITVQADLSSIAGSIDVASLPQQDKRYGTWLYLKDLKVLPQQLVFSYQVINVPTENTLITTPEFDIKQINEQWFVIPPVSLTIGPLLTSTEEGGIVNIKAKSDISPALIDTSKTKQQLGVFAIVSAFSGLILALWHFGWKPKNRKPFSQAMHDLSRLRWQRTAEPEQAIRILHAAFNRTAGTIVTYGEIDKLVQQHAWLAPLQEDIETFYHHSAQHFFARKVEREPDLKVITKLAKACRAKEKVA